MIPGHEFYGVEIGSQVRDVQIGARVSGEGHIVCGNCRNCRAGRRQMCIRTSGVGVNRDGAFAEFIVIPESNVWVHPHDIDPDLGAIFDPFGNAVHTALSFPLVGEDILITGAGPIGLMAAAVARHVGARFIVMTDISDPRLALAKQMGADLTVNVSRSRIAEAQKTLGMQEGFDVGFEMSGPSSARDDQQSQSRWTRGYARIAHCANRSRLGKSRHAHDHHKRHLWPRDVRDLGCNECDVAIKQVVARCAFFSDHRPFPGNAVERRI
jgi:threonine dehydrogenase-like Zn-dependent dehydrogenase